MLVLSRKSGERLLIGDNVELIVKGVSGNRVVLALSAPGNIRIIRGELEQNVRSYEEDAREDDPAVSKSPDNAKAILTKDQNNLEPTERNSA